MGKGCVFFNLLDWVITPLLPWVASKYSFYTLKNTAYNTVFLDSMNGIFRTTREKNTDLFCFTERHP
ncbi:hypothetical protein AUJ44_03275 [Candidatus Nomurabacteria bacterium CG1_02_47_685]|uniref:Uncharacterized protein n=1 Tax=Candidatus Nomurabacteria bacterium CG1_02_47_685 TaxID=1805282 RepID=A0A1J4VBJ3_9BACT|nr:MAG: hypothetical protein AUJ44_03275 [Candidatus Nomurabacteria bacterium CG1_02_47_685]